MILRFKTEMFNTANDAVKIITGKADEQLFLRKYLRKFLSSDIAETR